MYTKEDYDSRDNVLIIDPYGAVVCAVSKGDADALLSHLNRGAM